MNTTAPNPAELRYRTASEYGVLYSHAHETAIPGLVVGGFASRTDAHRAGGAVANRQGVRYAVMALHSNGWVSKTGKAPGDLLREYAATGKWDQ